jgi:hypothetical protein
MPTKNDNKQVIKKAEKILENFRNKISVLQYDYRNKILEIIKEADNRQIEKIKNELKS